RFWALTTGTKEGFSTNGYNGSNFISFENETWVVAQPQAEKVKEKWVGDPVSSQGNKDYLEKTCIEWLQNYLSYRKKALEYTEPTVGKVTHKEVNDSLKVLICQVFGFNPKESRASWRRDGEIWKDKTFLRNMTPNSDGTYYLRLSIEIDPKERDHFRCHLEHKGLQEPLVLALKEEREPPVVEVTCRIQYKSLVTLVCRVYGFYPKEVNVTWRKDGEVWKENISSAGVLPNSDGTYHTWLRIEVDPEEKRDHYRCYVEHAGLPEPL
ncbi:Major histocompatibility complex class I-related protein, partial [Ophiophagus hannah]